MKPGLNLGQRYEFSVIVTEAMQARFGDVLVHPLYSTASMITHMEWAARQHILPYLEPGEEGVGYHIDVKHLKPTPLGATVRVAATVSELKPNRVSCQVEAWQEAGTKPISAPKLVGQGIITQALVQLADLYPSS